MSSLLWMDNTSYRSWQADEFKKKAEAAAFPTLARQAISLYNEGIPISPPEPEPPQPPISPPLEAPAGLGYTGMGDIPSEAPISSSLEMPTVAAPSIPPPMPPPVPQEPQPGYLPYIPREGPSTLLSETPDLNEVPSLPQGLARELPIIGEALKAYQGVRGWQEEQAQRYSQMLSSGTAPEVAQVGLETFPGAGAIAGAGILGLKAARPAAKVVAGAVLHTDAEKFISKFPLPEVQAILRGAMGAAPEKFEAARRGVIPDTMVDTLASKLGTTAEKIITAWKPGVAANAENVRNMAAVLDLKTQEVLDLKDAAQQALKTGVDPLIGKIRLQLAMAEQGALQEAFLGVRAEAGRSLRQFSQNVKDTIASGNVNTMRDLLQKTSGKWSPEMFDKFLALDPNDVEAVYSFIRNTQKPFWWRYPQAVFMSSLLSGPRTVIVSFVGNSITTILGPLEKAGAAVAELRAPLQGRPRERFFGEVPAEVFGTIRGIPVGLAKAFQVMKGGAGLQEMAKFELRRMEVFTSATPRLITSPVGAVAGVAAGGVAPAENWDDRIRNMGIGLLAGAAFGAAKPAWLSAVINTPTRASVAADGLFRNMNFSAAMHAEAYRAAAKEGIGLKAMPERIAELLANSTTEMVDEATKMGAYRVFQQKPGKWTAAAVQFREKVVLSLFLVPFLQTPVNIVKYGMERTPLGIVKLATAKTPAERSDVLGRLLLGAGISTTFAMYALDGKITGPAPGKPGSREREAFYAQGKLPYAVKVGDTWYSYQRAEPFNMPLLFAAEAVSAFRQKEEIPAQDRILDVVRNIADNILSQPYLTGIADITTALEDPGMAGGKYFGRLLSGFVPLSAAMRTATQLQEKTAKQPQGFVEALESGIGVTGGIPERLTGLGEPSEFQGSPLSPYRISQEKPDKYLAELARLEKMPTGVGGTIAGVKLSRELQQQHEKDAGLIRREAYQPLVDSKSYTQASDKEREEMLQKVQDLSSQYVNSYLIGSAFMESVKKAPTTEARDKIIQQGKESLGPLGFEAAMKGQYAKQPSQDELREIAKDISLITQVRWAYDKLPKYVKTSKEEEQEIDRIKATISDQAQRVGNRDLAIKQLSAQVKTEAQKKVFQKTVAIIRNPAEFANPQRKKMLKAYPQMEKYLGAIIEEQPLFP